MTRAAVRRLAAALGLAAGRGPHHARRIAVSADADADLTLAPALVIAPAPGWSKAQRTRLRRAAAKLARHGVDAVVFAVLGTEAVVVEAVAVPGPGVRARIAAREAGTVQRLDVVPGVEARVEPGAVVVAGTVLLEAAAADLPALVQQLSRCAVWGVASDLERVRALAANADVAAGRCAPALAALVPEPDVRVLAPGLQTTIQALPGRLGLWEVGVPPSGPMDALAAELANRCVGNPRGAPLLECTLAGPTLRFARAAVVAVTGAACPLELDGLPVASATPLRVRPGQVLRLGAVPGPGVRTYLAVRGGFAAQEVLGSAATFTLGGFGGHHGRALAAGDGLRLARGKSGPMQAVRAPAHACDWTIGVLEGPHSDPDFLTTAGREALAAATWTVSPQSNRTGVRLVGPKPQWARSDGGEAGLHPSNLHDTPYAFAAIDLTGDTPVVLGPDGPSLGGFVCPFVVAAGERWKLGQLAAGDTVRLRVVSRAAAARLRRRPGTSLPTAGRREPPVLHRRAAEGVRPELCCRRAGDDFLLIEYGPMALDLELRLRVQELHRELTARRIPGVIDLVPAVRSLQVHYDPDGLDEDDLLELVRQADDALPDAPASVPSRIVHLPLSWDDPATRKAIGIYTRTVNPDAPWCPSNIEFIRRINGLRSEADVQDIVFGAEYLVLGLGDVYLGAPVATPVDPRHRLVTTKYNPARTWTPENAVGIGGAYLCVYGMEGPGGYQFVGRTIQVWSTWRGAAPQLLRHFDRIRFFPVSAAELLRLREDVPRGRYHARIDDGEFRITDHRAHVAQHAGEIAAFTRRRESAFAAERARWGSGGGGRIAAGGAP